ncbi:MAG: heme-copper oxidase subunit III [Thermoflexus sp.]|jgi:cytochrome c oxidase subunit 3|nr:heme-copper oxidase subunit III [Thermoflexus sp.]
MASHHPAAGSEIAVDSRKLGIWVFLASEVIFFASLIVAYLVLHNRVTGGPTVHKLSLTIPTINTMILLTSSVAMVLALAHLRDGNRRASIAWLLTTAWLGICFLILKGVEYNHHLHEGLTPSVNVFGSAYYAVTGFHAAHVAVGVIWILSVALGLRHRLSPQNDVPVEAAGLYWHFVDLVWVAIFVVVYLMR